MTRTVSIDRIMELRAMAYADYLQTSEWRRRRDRALAHALWQCEWPDCRQRHKLQVHHKSYEHLGEELDCELVVLCADHHAGFHRQTQGRDIFLVIIRELMRRGGYSSIADFMEGLKLVCAEYKIRYDPDELNRAIGPLQRDLERELAFEPLELPRVVLPEDDGSVSHQEAAEILTSLREHLQASAEMTPRSMPIAPVPDQRKCDRLKALQIVGAEIKASIERCEQLERETDA